MNPLSWLLFGGCALCMAVALWLWTRVGPADAELGPETNPTEPAAGSAKDADRTAFVSSAEAFAAIDAQRAQRAKPLAPEASAATEVISQAEVQALVAGQAPSPDEGSNEAAEGTTLLSREALLPDAIPAATEPGTVVLDKQEMLAAAERRARATPASTPGGPPVATPTPLSTPPPPSTSDELVQARLRDGLTALSTVFIHLGQEPHDTAALARGAERTWRGALEALAPGSARAAAWALALVREPEVPPQRRLAAALTFLELSGEAAIERVPGLDDELDEPSRRALLDALVWSGAPEAERVLRAGLCAATTSARPAWLSACAARCCDLDEAELRPLLESPHSEHVALGLRLVPYSSARARLVSPVDRHLFSPTPELREAAILAALVLGRTPAAAEARRAARTPELPALTTLYATTTTKAGLDALRAWAAEPSAPAHAAAAIALADQLESAAGVREALLTRAGSIRQAVADALLVRSRGATVLRPRQLPSALVEAVSSWTPAD